MSDELGELTRVAGGVEGRLTRRLAGAPAEVWARFVDPAKLAEWVAPGRIEPRLGGAVRLDFADSGTVIDSAVTAFEDGRRVAFSWSKSGEPARPVRFDLAADGADTALTLTVFTPDGEDPGRSCAGWEAHLSMLAAALAGAPIAFPFETFKAAREGYRAKVAALG